MALIRSGRLVRAVYCRSSFSARSSRVSNGVLAPPSLASGQRRSAGCNSGVAYRAAGNRSGCAPARPIPYIQTGRSGSGSSRRFSRAVAGQQHRAEILSLQCPLLAISRHAEGSVITSALPPKADIRRRKRVSDSKSRHWMSALPPIADVNGYGDGCPLMTVSNPKALVD